MEVVPADFLLALYNNRFIYWISNSLKRFKNTFCNCCILCFLLFLRQNVHKQQQLQHQEFQRQMEERLELLQRQQPFPPADVGLAPDSDFLDVARTRSDCSDHSSPNVTPRASNHSNLSVSEVGSSIYEHEDGGKALILFLYISWFVVALISLLEICFC